MSSPSPSLARNCAWYGMPRYVRIWRSWATGAPSSGTVSVSFPNNAAALELSAATASISAAARLMDSCFTVMNLLYHLVQE